MTIQVICNVYNEEYLIPIFLEHYKFVDEILILLDSHTNDNTYKKLLEYKKNKYFNIKINKFYQKDCDTQYMTDKINEAIYNSTYDYIIVVDCDELIFNKNLNLNLLEYIENNKKEYYFCALHHLYPNYEFEKKDIDKNIPIWEQRKYGYLENIYIKPIIINRILFKNKYKFRAGKHSLIDNNGLIINHDIDYDFLGAHLNNINYEFSINRILKNRKYRISNEDKKKGFSCHYNDMNENSIKDSFNKKYNKLW